GNGGGTNWFRSLASSLRVRLAHPRIPSHALANRTRRIGINRDTFSRPPAAWLGDLHCGSTSSGSDVLTSAAPFPPPDSRATKPGRPPAPSQRHFRLSRCRFP